MPPTTPPTAADRAALAYLGTVLAHETGHPDIDAAVEMRLAAWVNNYMRAYEQGAAYMCERILIDALNSGMKLALPLPTAALRGADNWAAVRALSLALAM